MYEFNSRVEIAKRAAVTKAAFRPHSSKRKQVPAPVTILKGDNLFDAEFRKSGRPTAASERLLDVMGCKPVKRSEPAVSSARANLEMMLKGR